MNTDQGKADRVYKRPVSCGFTRDVIEEFASEFAQSLDLSAGSELAPAVERLGGQIHWVSTTDQFEESTDGSVVVHGLADFDLYIASDVGFARKRFTIAHELGHYILHFVNGDQQPVKAERYGNGDTEREANWFAAGLLMPTDAFKNEFAKLNGSLAALAETFEVSKPAAEIRAQYLNL